MENQNSLLRKYADMAANPDGSFSAMANEVSKDPSMLRYLNGESNVKGGPNENYGREFMELFTLGVNHIVTGAKNYSENDVAQLAKSFAQLVVVTRLPNLSYANALSSCTGHPAPGSISFFVSASAVEKAPPNVLTGEYVNPL